eukprot:5465458-Prymnesium_polylepis.1
MAILSRSALSHYFRVRYAAGDVSPKGRSCPNTAHWPEGRLTDTLLSSGVDVRPLDDPPELHAMLYRDFRVDFPAKR